MRANLEHRPSQWPAGFCGICKAPLSTQELRGAGQWDEPLCTRCDTYTTLGEALRAFRLAVTS
jgi:hypothetical protein